MQEENKVVNVKQKRNVLIQDIYFYVSLGLLVFGFLIFVWGIINSKALQAIPEAVFDIIRLVMFYHLPHIVFGIIFLISLVKKVKNKVVETKVIKTVLGIVFSPISFMILFAGFLLLGFTSCAASI